MASPSINFFFSCTCIHFSKHFVQIDDRQRFFEYKRVWYAHKFPHSRTVTNDEGCKQVKLVQCSVHCLFVFTAVQIPACTPTFTPFLFPHILTLICSLNRLRKNWICFPVKMVNRCLESNVEFHGFKFMFGPLYHLGRATERHRWFTCNLEHCWKWKYP